MEIPWARQSLSYGRPRMALAIQGELRIEIQRFLESG